MTQSHLPVWFLFFACLANTETFDIMKQQLFNFPRFEGTCQGYENLAMTFHNLTIVHYGRIVAINGVFIVKHDLIHQIQAVVALKRCKNRDALDSCELYHNMKFSRCCDLLNMKNQLWTSFVDSIHPPIQCPVKAGRYSLDNATLDASVPLFPLSGWYWRINMKSYDTVTKEQLLCLNSEGEVITIRKTK